MYKRIFLDANILVDFIDIQRIGHEWSKMIVMDCLDKKIKLFTSCDIVTTIYYLSAKINKKKALEQIFKINQFCRVIEFSNKEVEEACSLMLGGNFTDLEDTIQFVLAKKSECELIISNDAAFVSPNIELISSPKFCEREIK